VYLTIKLTFVAAKKLAMKELEVFITKIMIIECVFKFDKINYF